VTFSDYQAIPAINATAIKAGQISMRHMRHKMTGHDDDCTTSMRWGRLVHSALLEPDAFFKRVSVWECTRRGKAWDAFEAEHDPEFILTKTEDKDEFANLFALSQSAHADKDAHRILSGSRHEQAIQWTGKEYGAAKARLDGWHDTDGVVEVKTCRQIQSFPRQFAGLNYDIQTGWYTLGAESCGMGKDVPCVVIVIESAPPWDVAVYRVPAMALAIGRKKAVETAAQYRACEKKGAFPGVSDGMTELKLPEWYGGEAVAEMFAEQSAEALGL
jgi:hypothetical protein